MSSTKIVALLILASGCKPSNDSEVVPIADLSICCHNQSNTPDKTCIVDGDSLWLEGVNIRLKQFDAPESRSNICGGFKEIDLAHEVTDRLSAAEKSF